MIGGLSTSLTCTTPLHHNNIHKLSKVKIFPRVVVHKKNTTLRGTLTFQILFQGKVDRTGVDEYMIIKLHFKGLVFDGIQKIESLPPYLIFLEYNSKNRDTTSTYQSCTGRVNKIFQCMGPFWISIFSILHILTTCNSEQLWK